MGRWGDGEMGRWGDGEMGRRGENRGCAYTGELAFAPSPCLPVSPSPCDLSRRTPGREQDLFVYMRRRITRDADVFDVFNGNAGSLQAVTDGLSGKAGAVLLAIEALLFNGGNKLAVSNQRRRRVTVKCVDAEDDHRC